MTVTLIYGDTSDGYLWNNDVNYNNVRIGNVIESLDTASAHMYVGQSAGGGAYTNMQSFIRFSWSAIPNTERVVSAALGLNISSQDAPSIPAAIEARNYDWSPGGLTTSDWNPPSSLNARRLDGQFLDANALVSGTAYAGSDELLAHINSGATTYEAILITDRQRNGNVPSGPEAITLNSANQSGTSLDPVLMYTTTKRSTLYGVLGAQVVMPGGEAWAYLDSDGGTSPVIRLRHRNSAGTITTIETISTGFAAPNGAQAYALAVDYVGNLYVFGPSSTGENILAVLPFMKMGALTWTVQPIRTVPLPANTTALNNLAATFHPTGSGGFLFVANGHTQGPGALTGSPWGVTYTVLSVANLISGAGSLVLQSGYAAPSLIPSLSSRMYSVNETGTGLDVAAPLGGNELWGFLMSFNARQHLGENDWLGGARYILNSTGTAVTHASYANELGWGVKDASAKVRVVPISSTAAAFITADENAGWGLTVNIRQHSGSTAGSVSLGRVILGDQGIATMPDGPVIGHSPAWDVVYNSVENRLWVYYVDAGDAGRLLRTSISLSTMQAEANAVEVWNAPGAEVIQAIRVARNAESTRECLVTIAHSTTSTQYVVDLFNLAPTAPTLTPRANYDATAAATFAWTFNDPNPGDTQSAYQLVIERVDTGATVLDTGKVVSATSSRNVAGGTLTNALSYRWRVSTWDAEDEQSPYSDYGTFSTSAGGTVTITVPATDNLPGVITDDIEVQWSVSGTTQAGYRVWLYRGATLVSDSGWVTSTATAHTVSGMTSDEEHTIQVRVRNASNVESGTGSRLVTPSYASPEKPTISVSPNSELGYIAVSVTNPPPGPPVAGGTEWDFESAGDVTNWVATNGTRAHSTAQAHKGAGSLLLTTTGTPSFTIVRNPTDRVTVTPGERYTVRMWVRSSVAKNVNAAIDWFDGSGVYLSSSFATHAVPANVWTYITGTGTAPAGAAAAEYGPSNVDNPATGATLYMDEVVLTGASDRPEVSSNEILRRPVGSTGAWTVLGTTGPDGTFLDYTAASGVVYEYVARGVA